MSLANFFDFEKRTLCTDGSCTGIINEKGVCGTCGKLYDSNVTPKETIPLGSVKVSDPSQFQVNATQYMVGRNFRYHAEITHKGLMKTRSVTASTEGILKEKVFAQIEIWDEMWKKEVKKTESTLDKEEKKFLASRESEEAQTLSSSVKNLLLQTLTVADAIDWESLKDRKHFKKPKPEKKQPPAPPNLLTIPPEPKQSDGKYVPVFSFSEKIFPSKKQEKLASLKKKFEEDHNSWVNAKTIIEKKNETLQMEYDALLRNNEEEYVEETKKWEEEKIAFKNSQREVNEALEARKQQYLQAIPEAIIDYCDMVLSKSPYPETFPKEFELDYIQGTKTLIVEYRLPAIEDLPRVKEVKYVQSRDDFTKVLISDSELSKMYDITESGKYLTGYRA